MALIDLNIAIAIAERATDDRLPGNHEVYFANHDFIFLPVTNPRYTDRLNDLSNLQYMKRIRNLYNILDRVN